MSKRFKRYFIIFIGCILLMSLLAIVLFFKRHGVFKPYMKLNGESSLELEINDIYIEKGVIVEDNFKDIKKDISIQSNVNTTKTGIYTVTYTYQTTQKKRIIKVVDTIPPVLTLIQDAHLILFQDEAYVEYGVEIEDNSKKDLSDHVKITHQIDSHILGNYAVKYEVSDPSGNLSSIERMVEVVKNPMNEKLHYHYDAIENTKYSWWFKKANDHERKPSTYDQKIMDEYNAYYIGNDEKIIYLSFDEGGNDTTYIKEITDVLNNHNIQATYFLTRNYIINESEFMNQLVKMGHEIGNHTRNHLDMTTLANAQGCDKFVREIMETHQTIYEVTKKIPPMIFRFPKGEFSKRSLAMVHDLGFRTYFWSHAYNDYGSDVSKEESYNNLVSHLHKGALYLLHPSNLGNYEAMEDFIVEAKSQGYSFGLVSQIKKD